MKYRDRNHQALIRYRLTQAHETVAETEKLIGLQMLPVAVNRIYYGMFYALTALALKNDFESSKHIQLLGWFNQRFIKTGVVEEKYGKIIRSAFKNRTECDYAPFIEFKVNDVRQMHAEMVAFIDRIEKLIDLPSE